jgi:hypothetical protein
VIELYGVIKHDGRTLTVDELETRDEHLRQTLADAIAQRQPLVLAVLRFLGS